MSGLSPAADAMRGADEQTLLVRGRSGTDEVLYACDIDLCCAPLPVTGDISLDE